MRIGTKTWLIIASSMILLGCMIGGTVMSIARWDFTKLSSSGYENKRHEINENFNSISIEADTADLVFALSDDGKCTVECYEEKKVKHSVSVENDTLVIGVENKKAWYDYIGIHLGSPKVTIYLSDTQYTAINIRNSAGHVNIPEDFSFFDVGILLITGNVDCSASASGQLKIKASTGSIELIDCSAGALDLAVTTGEVTVSDVVCRGEAKIKTTTGKAKLTNLKCENLISTGTTGDIILENTIAEESLSVQRSTGDVKFRTCDASEIYVKTATGDVSGNFLSDKIFITNTKTGVVKVPVSTSGGICEITSKTGSIKLEIK